MDNEVDTQNNSKIGWSDVGVKQISERGAVYVSADFLYWTVEEDGVGNDNWCQVTTTLPSHTIVLDVQQLSFDYSPGFRIGIGGSPFDRLDVELEYTWFRTEAKDRASGELISSPFFGNYYASNPKYNNAYIQFSVLFNMFDLQIRREILVSNGLLLNPFAGIKGGWINQKIETQWEKQEFEATETLENFFWGIGPSCGVNTQWKLGKYKKSFFSVFANFSGALMWADWSFSDKYTSSHPKTVEIVFQESYQASLTLQNFMGIGWETSFNRDSSRFSFRMGYETQYWLEQLQFMNWNVGKLNNKLTLLGGTFDVCFDF